MQLHATGVAGIEVTLDYPAHSSYPRGQCPDHELETAITVQLANAATRAGQAGKTVRAAGCADELAVDMQQDPRTLQVVARALYKFDPAIVLACTLDRVGKQVAHDCGVRVVAPDAANATIQPPSGAAP